MIEKVSIENTDAICDIYNYYVKNTIITFEENPVTYKEMENRVSEISSSYPFYIFKENNEILGYAYAYKFKERSAYRFASEVTVYLKNGSYGNGIGTKLYSRLLEELKVKNIHSAIGIIALPNEASVRLHAKFGFNKVAHFTEVGLKFNKWIDVGYWELLLK